MRKSSQGVILATLIAGFISQNQVCTAVEGRKPDIRGIITTVSITDEKKKLGSLRVEGKQESDTGFDKAMLRISAATRLEKSVKGKCEPATISEFKEGCVVEAGFNGPVAESYPVQANAGWILLLKKKQ